MAEGRKGLIIVVSAPSGSGKTTLVSRLINGMPGMKRSVSYTTRDPRPGEIDGEDYIFISEEEFNKKRDSGEFLEWEEIFRNYYGTSKKQLTSARDAGEDIVLSIDVKGARTVKEEFPESFSIFIMPPSREELEARLRNRNTDHEEQVSLRLEESRKEMDAADDYDYLVINDDIDVAVEDLKTIIESERNKPQK